MEFQVLRKHVIKLDISFAILKKIPVVNFLFFYYSFSTGCWPAPGTNSSQKAHNFAIVIK